MTAPHEIIQLVEKFDYNRDAYLSGRYNETQLRREFIDPFFEVLGWDISNKQGWAEAYKDVIHDDAIKVGSATKAPDYCFRIGGTRKFFIEAKKPSIDIKDAIAPAYQVRRYAWSAKLPLSILTDFEEFAVYDCRIKPTPSDKASAARTIYATYNEYPQRWDEIASIFSRQAVLKGSFDKYVESNKTKKGTTEVDNAFLEEIEYWRDLLARHLALRNSNLTQRELNFSVQRIIDRIIFLRICEDRAIEEYGKLKTQLNGDGIYVRLCQLFRQADERYNSGLFHFRKEKDQTELPDELTLRLLVDDKPLKEIIKNLYYPDSPYEFSVLPADILGQVYEQFLGKVIRLTSGHRATVEDKPEVKKAGGVYYTPTYIVDYIVKNTVGKLIEGKTPKQIARLTILDPACGSGSFLISAYQHLLDWHRDWYIEDGTNKWATGRSPALHQGLGGDWRLTTAERKRILLNNIYGVDIDPQAVEVTKLSLLLKVLEDENEQTLNRQLALFHERALPDLGNNIKCGNSLIGPDFYDGQQMSFLDDEERYRINVFNWEDEFPIILSSGGFDAIIGNPPWGAQLNEHELKYLRKENRDIIVRMIDSFMYFVHQGCKKLNNSRYFGMILPDVVLYQRDNEKLRQFILRDFQIIKLLNMGDVFEGVTRPAAILVLGKGLSTDHLIDAIDVTRLNKIEKPNAIINDTNFIRLHQESIKEIPGSLFITENPKKYEIWRKVISVSHKLLKEMVDSDGIQRGVSPDLKKAFIVDDNLVTNFKLEKAKLRKVLTGGKHVKRYFIEDPNLNLIYTKPIDDFTKLPNICAYIEQYRKDISCVEVKQNKHPLYSLHRPRDERIFIKKRKVIGVITGDRITVALDEMKTFATDGLYLFGVMESIDINYVMGILNSRLFIFLYRLLTLEKGRVLAQVKPTILAELPIRVISQSNLIDKSRHDRIVELVTHIQILQKQLANAMISHERVAIQRQINAVDRQIDLLVYELYNLSTEDIEIIERETKLR